ncbi:MAG: glycoside hydrolase family 36 protein [Akkermansiaceae bacterium]
MNRPSLSLPSILRLLPVALLLLPQESLHAKPGSDSPVVSLVSRIQQSKPTAILTDGAESPSVVIEGAWTDGRWSGVVRNTSTKPVSVREIVLCELDHGLPAETPVYGESFQMLAQITGTLGKPADLGKYTDREHYRIPEPEGYRTASGLLTISPPQGQSLTLAFTSCHQFIGRIGFNHSRLRVFVETEDLTLAPMASWKLESFACFTGNHRDETLVKVASEIQKNHPRKLPAQPPTGWCSWYTFFEEVTLPDVVRNLQFLKENLPQPRYIQIDDGYQSKMGDWLETGKAFGGNIRNALGEIKAAGREPAIWVAPFIAEKTSRVFQQHPDWFVKGNDGKPLDSSTVGFGGWRYGPWYVLDGTHPEVQKHLENVFRTMREDWGVTYFKLDANYWGAIHGGQHHDPDATRIQAYRAGMAAIQKGAGDAFILGCNAPIWPSLGLVDGMRTSGDIAHTREVFKGCALENLSRIWQNGTLWWNDPDCVILTERSQKDIRRNPAPKNPTLSDDDFKLHVASIRASGGMVLSGDDMPAIPPARLSVLKKLLVPTGNAMRFESSEFTTGRVTLNETTEEVALFNWSEHPLSRSITVKAGSSITDFWTGESTLARETSVSYLIPARSAVLLEIKSQ